MTTVVDPAGIPSPVYNRSGTTIVSLTGAAGGATGTAGTTPIVLYSGVTIVLGTVTDTNFGFLLPEDAEIGSVVEFYQVAGNVALPEIYVVAGQSFNMFDPTRTNGVQLSRAVFRKVAATNWQVIISA